jgi:hypothetical protein
LALILRSTILIPARRRKYQITSDGTFYRVSGSNQ